ncbi:hypothetical protein R1flu_006073 [Riccia fluitans]|uniref:Uncharacterized protein n=1 Tax=Riccia fluitans TaxID=41844 RepID=A0ABD1YV03_9MARC
MASLGRIPSLCGYRSAPAIHYLGAHYILTSRGRECIPSRHIREVSITGFSLFKNLSMKLAAQHVRSKSGSFYVNSDLWKYSNSIRRVDSRACYYSESFQYGRATAPAEQYRQVEQDGDQFPRPPLIWWEKELANAVQLIGNVGKDVDIKYLETGKIVAKTTLAVKKLEQQSEDSSWFELEFWDDLAETAAQHVKKGDQIFIRGTVSVDKITAPENTYTRVKMAVSNLCFVESYCGQRRAYVQPDTSLNEGSANQTDNRWAQNSASRATPQPNWNSPSLSQQQAAQSGTSAGGTTGKGNYEEESLATEKRWQAFFADSSQWWDNRLNKKNPKAPDFKHKSTQEVLWLKSWNNPPWVAAQLAVLDEKVAQTGLSLICDEWHLSLFYQTESILVKEKLTKVKLHSKGYSESTFRAETGSKSVDLSQRKIEHHRHIDFMEYCLVSTSVCFHLFSAAFTESAAIIFAQDFTILVKVEYMSKVAHTR